MDVRTADCNEWERPGRAREWRCSMLKPWQELEAARIDLQAKRALLRLDSIIQVPWSTIAVDHAFIEEMTEILA